MNRVCTFKEDCFIDDSHLVKAGALARVIETRKDSTVIILINDPFKEEYLIDKTWMDKLSFRS